MSQEIKSRMRVTSCKIVRALKIQSYGILPSLHDRADILARQTIYTYIYTHTHTYTYIIYMEKLNSKTYTK